ncbi:MAG: DUF3313 domain-containing protein [Deltaproteobacteria bacterium]|nr:MAG: DUF3313 domain-containing protein [Deltaproteobacteria bacterium]
MAIRRSSGTSSAALLAGALALACASKPAAPAPDSGFLPEPERMTEQRDRFPFDRVWVSPDYVRDRYTRLWIKPVNTDHLMNMDWYDQSTAQHVKIREGANLLARYMHNAFRTAIYYDPNKRYTLVEQVDPRTLILEMAIVEVTPNDATLGALGLVLPPLRRAGEKGSVAMEGRIRDGETQEILGMFADREEARQRVLDPKAVTWWGHSEAIIDVWAKELVKLINTPPDFTVQEESPSFSLQPW